VHTTARTLRFGHAHPRRAAAAPSCGARPTSAAELAARRVGSRFLSMCSIGPRKYRGRWELTRREHACTRDGHDFSSAVLRWIAAIDRVAFTLRAARRSGLVLLSGFFNQGETKLTKNLGWFRVWLPWRGLVADTSPRIVPSPRIVHRTRLWGPVQPLTSTCYRPRERGLGESRLRLAFRERSPWMSIELLLQSRATRFRLVRGAQRPTRAWRTSFRLNPDGSVDVRKRQRLCADQSAAYSADSPIHSASK